MSGRRIGIPEPDLNLESLLATTLALKEYVEVMTASRGNPLDGVVRYQDLVDLNIIKASDIASLDAIIRQRRG